MGAGVVRLEGVSKTYPGGNDSILALDGVSLAVREGEFLAVTGPSGCGKSTLLHIMGGMDSPTKGRAFLGGRELTGLGDAELSRIRREEVGFVYQFFNLLPTMTAWENVALPLVLQKKPWAETARLVERLLDRVGLSNRASHFPRQLSGGEMQRVAVARAIVARPRIILADEPTGNIDSQRGHELLELLSGLVHEDGFTAVIATHATDPLSYATRRVRMRDGRILEGEE